MIQRLASLSILVCLLSSCLGTEKIDELQASNPSGSGFEQMLARMYLDFVKQERSQYDWYSAVHFAKKGVALLETGQVEPEQLEEWDIPEQSRDALSDARAALLAKLTPAFKQTQPEQAAKLLFYYDCWVEEQEEAWQTEAIDQCRQGFFRYLDEQDAPVRLGGPISNSYLLFFPWDSPTVETESIPELEDIARALRQQGDYHVVIHGHADRSGGTDYNLDLSQTRATFIQNYLIQRGVPATRMSYYAFGESDPKIETPDGTKQRANRRVEIFIE